MEFMGFLVILGLMMYGFGKGYAEASGETSDDSPPWPYEIEDMSYEEKTLETESPVEEDKKSDWDKICEKAIEKAIEGDSSARTWVTKNVYEAKNKEEFLTDSAIMEDAMVALKSLGYTIGEARNVVESLAKDKKYDCLSDLLKDAMG
jgi:hypothetical protein